MLEYKTTRHPKRCYVFADLSQSGHSHLLGGGMESSPWVINVCTLKCQSNKTASESTRDQKRVGLSEVLYSVISSTRSHSQTAHSWICNTKLLYNRSQLLIGDFCLMTTVFQKTVACYNDSQTFQPSLLSICYIHTHNKA